MGILVLHRVRGSEELQAETKGFKIGSEVEINEGLKDLQVPPSAEQNIFKPLEEMLRMDGSASRTCISDQLIEPHEAAEPSSLS